MKFKPNKLYKKILVIPDAHIPWADWDALKECKKWYDRHKPDLVVNLGDLTDQKIWSRWTKDVDDFSPIEEFTRAMKDLKKLHSWFPNMLILRGNHDTRVLNRAIEAGIPHEMFRDVDDIFGFDGWEWYPRNKRLIVKTERGPILFMHGDEMAGTPVQKSRHLGMSVIQGHTHKSSCEYTQNLKGHFFGAEMGCIMDIQSKAARYAQANPVGVSIGFGVVQHGLPFFIPYLKKGK